MVSVGTRSWMNVRVSLTVSPITLVAVIVAGVGPSGSAAIGTLAWYAIPPASGSGVVTPPIVTVTDTMA